MFIDVFVGEFVFGFNLLFVFNVEVVGLLIIILYVKIDGGIFIFVFLIIDFGGVMGIILLYVIGFGILLVNINIEVYISFGGDWFYVFNINDYCLIVILFGLMNIGFLFFRF